MTLQRRKFYPPLFSFTNLAIINHMKNMVISGVYDIKFLEQNTLIIAEYLGLIDKEVRSNGEDGIVGAQCAWGIFSVAVNVEK